MLNPRGTLAQFILADKAHSRPSRKTAPANGVERTSDEGGCALLFSNASCKWNSPSSERWRLVGEYTENQRDLGWPIEGLFSPRVPCAMAAQSRHHTSPCWYVSIPSRLRWLTLPNVRVGPALESRSISCKRSLDDMSFAVRLIGQVREKKQKRKEKLGNTAPFRFF